MSEVYKFSQAEILCFTLVLIRMSAFVVTWPIFGTESVATQVKILFALALGLMVFPTLHEPTMTSKVLEANLIWLIVKEAFIGLSIGYLARLFLFTFRIAGELMSVSMGLSSATLYNPAVEGQSTAIEQFYLFIASLFYIMMNGHHFLLQGLISSFSILPLSEQLINVQQFSGFGSLVHEVMTIGLSLSAPVVISILFMNIVLGIVGRTVPQVNVLVTSLPVNILVGFLVMITTLPLVVSETSSVLQLSLTRMMQLLRSY